MADLGEELSQQQHRGAAASRGGLELGKGSTWNPGSAELGKSRFPDPSGCSIHQGTGAKGLQLAVYQLLGAHTQTGHF